MKIGTLNIDWAKKSKSKKHYLKIEEYLDQQDFDFLILTEAIKLNLKKYKYSYFSEQIPENIEYENLNYTKYLDDEPAFRTIIYSKIPAKKQYSVCDYKTCLALEFETDFGDLIIYATIIGTWFKKQPFAKNELENCIKDCTILANLNPNLFIVGDLNTSFMDRKFTINLKSLRPLLAFRISSRIDGPGNVFEKLYCFLNNKNAGNFVIKSDNKTINIKLPASHTPNENDIIIVCVYVYGLTYYIYTK